jgi:hypothetical protein
MNVTIEDIAEIVLAICRTGDARFALHGGAVVNEAPEVIGYEGREFKLMNRQDDWGGDEVQFWVYSKITPQQPSLTAAYQIGVADVFQLLLSVHYRTDGKYELGDGTTYDNAPDGFTYQGYEFELSHDDPHDYIPKSSEEAFWDYTNAGATEEFENLPEYP